jgi:hypothetical protein
LVISKSYFFLGKFLFSDLKAMCEITQQKFEEAVEDFKGKEKHD